MNLLIKTVLQTMEFMKMPVMKPAPENLKIYLVSKAFWNPSVGKIQNLSSHLYMMVL